MTYDLIKATDLLRDYKKLVPVNIFEPSRRPHYVQYRTLFYKILMDKNKMQDNEVAHFFKLNGLERERSGICIAVSKIKLVYRDNYPLRDVYDTYFDDLEEYRNTLEKTNLEKFRVKDERESDELSRLVDSVEEPFRRAELLEMVNLKIKSWSWKTNDTMTVYEGSF